VRNITMSGKTIRLHRLFKHNRDRLLVVPLDHSVSDGPIGCNQKYLQIIKDISKSTVDAIIVHKGRMRYLTENIYRNCSIVIHVSASTKYAADPNQKYIVADVEDAIRRGADCISLHVNVGSVSEPTQLRDMAVVADACDRYGIPLLAMMYARGEGVAGHPEKETLAHAANLAADLGADIVKLSMPKSTDDCHWVVLHSPLPILAAGGAQTEEAEFLNFIEEKVRAGVVGLAVGRNVFNSSNIPNFVNKIRMKMDNRRIGTRILNGMVYDRESEVGLELYNEPL